MAEERLAVELSMQVQTLHRLRKEKDLEELKLKAISDQYNSVEKDVIQMLEDLGLKSIKTPDGGNVILMEPKLKASFRDGMKEEGLKLLRDNNISEIITSQVHHDNLNRVIKERIENG